MSKSQTSIDARWDAVFGQKKENHDLDLDGRVRYKAHPETGEMVPDYMWHQLGMLPRQKSGVYIQKDYEPYQSPITGEVISGRRQRRYDLDKHGCRPYEGRHSETTEAEGYRRHQDERLDEALKRSMPQTLTDIRWQNNEPSEKDKHGNPKISWEL